jgi:hypothetical protein
LVYILVTASWNPSITKAATDASIKTHLAYPSFLKKLFDIGGNYTNYTLYSCEEAKLSEGLLVVAGRYQKIGALVAGYTFKVEPMYNVEEIAPYLK